MVNRYRAVAPAAIMLSSGGDYVKYEDYLALAAENVEMNKFIAQSCYVQAGENASWFPAIDHAPETPTTARIVAGLKADGRVEGVNFAASRLAAAFNHGFVDKPMAEVFDVVRMILTAKEDLANNPAEDGLSGEYAEKSLAEWEAVLREGADK